MFYQWTFYLKQQFLLLTVCDCFSSSHILLIGVDNEQGRDSMATAHTFQNRISSPLIGNNVGREQPQSIEMGTSNSINKYSS